MFMEGPTQASPGDILSYRLAYEVKSAGGAVAVIPFPPSTVYISSQLISGSGQLEWERGYVRWALQPGLGAIEVTFQVPADAGAQSFNVGAYEPGTETTGSNTVATSVASE
jgi:hypothetical protein